MDAPFPDTIKYLGPPPLPAAALAVLADPVAAWFRSRHPAPTAGQCLAWPAIRAGKSLLLGAPTGGGKTLAAFLPIISDLLMEGPAAGVRALYVAPLKALVNDVRRNLRALLAELAGCAGRPVARVGVRTGDTPARDRRRLRLEPPDILLTTPESLAVLLSQVSAGELFGGLRWVVIDEVHALAAGKRGADLAISLERLEAVAGGGLQRVGLSATCVPLAEAARFLVGTGRPCAVAQAGGAAALDLQVEPLFGDGAQDGGGFLRRLVERVGREVAAHRTTLVFANARGLAERLAWALPRRFPEWAGRVAVHHSSLAATRRREVERALKQGRLLAAVSSTSLELGIDIGSVDQVVLVHPPGDVVRLLQRVGRSGHGPGRPRRGLVLAAGPGELLEAAVTAAAGRAGQAEPLRVACHPLDVLCQHLLGMACVRPWAADEAFELVRRAHPYRDLPRADFDDCLAYLAGRRADGRAWLPARLRWDGDEFAVADARTARLVRRNLGTIIADEARAVLIDPDRCAGDPDAERARPRPVGEVDERFADRLLPGDRFLLDGRCLEFRHGERAALHVAEVAGRPLVPQWGADGWPLSPELAARLYLLRTRAAEALRDGPAALRRLLADEYGLGPRATDDLASHFFLQEAVSEVPDRGVCLVEAVDDGFRTELYVHTPLNRTGNDALARVAARRAAAALGRSVTSAVADLGFVLVVPCGAGLEADSLRDLLRPTDFDADLAAALADSPTLREAFRRAALVGLMLLRNPLGRRRKVGGADWGERRLFDQVRASEPGFVLLRQARRDLDAGHCDADAARRFVEEMAGGELRLRWLAAPSPFASCWAQAVAGPAEHPETPAESLRRLHALLTGPAAAAARRDGGPVSVFPGSRR